MKRVFALTAAAVLCLAGAVQADVFNLGTGFTNLETTLVGNPVNPGDSRYGEIYSPGLPGSFGAVAYNYNIGKYEVTAKQYTDFLNHKAKTSDPYGLYNSDMAAGQFGCKIERLGTEGNYTYTVAADYANRPVNYVSAWDACRFSNWLSNGQGNGDTESGTYNLNGYNGADGFLIQRSADWKWALTSEDEWYKAAYYDPQKPGGAGYWDYPTKSDIAPSNDLTDPDAGNTANYYNDGYTIGGPYWYTNVGEFENSASAYGTFDQGGNVWEWNEGTGTFRGLRGGSCGNKDFTLAASGRSEYFAPNTEGYAIGFRVTAAVVPEPSSVIALIGGLCCLTPALYRRRR